MTPPAATEVDASPRLRLAELRADLRAGLTIAVASVVAGAGLGVVWSRLAPRQLVAVAGAGSAPLSGEADHVFDATAVFVLLVGAFGLLVGGLVWRVRDHRGPVLLAAAVVGALAGSWLAARVGVAVAPSAPPVAVLLDRAQASASGTPGPPVPAQLVTLPATLGSWWSVVVGGLAAAVGYLVPASILGEEDMRRRAAEPPSGR